MVEEAKKRIAEDQSVSSLVKGLYGVLNIPLRSVSAALGATFTKGGEVYGKEAGKPAQIPRGDWQQRFWSLATDPEMEYGAVLEASAPGLPRPARQVSAILADLLLDPLVYITPAKVGQAARIGKPSEALARVLGINAAEAATSKSPLRPVGLALHLLLDPTITRAAVREALSAQPGEKLNTAFASLAQAQQLRKAVAEGLMEASKHSSRAIPDEVIQAADKVAKELGESHPDVQALRRVQQSMAASNTGHAYTESADVQAVYRLAGLDKLAGKLSPAARAEAERLSRQQRTAQSTYDKLLSAWKTTKTVFNPPSWIRNFYQNFILQYLAGEPMQPWQIARGLKEFITNPQARAEAWKSTESQSGRMTEVGEPGGLLGRITQKAGEGYEAMDRAAASILSLITGKPPQSYMFNYGEVPQTIDFLRRTGIAPFISWQYFAVPAVVRGLVNEPHRMRRLLQALITLQPDENKQGEWIQLPGRRETRAGSVLPLNPADFGPESDLLDPLSFWLLRPMTQLADIKHEEGYRPMGDDRTHYGLPALLYWLRDNVAPPAFGYYLPGIIAPPEPREGRRTPRTRTDYLLGLLGVPVRPVDKAADERARIKAMQAKQRKVIRRLKEQMKE